MCYNYLCICLISLCRLLQSGLLLLISPDPFPGTILNSLPSPPFTTYQCSFHAELFTSPYICQALSRPCHCTQFLLMEHPSPSLLWRTITRFGTSSSGVTSSVKPSLTSLGHALWLLEGSKHILLAHVSSCFVFHCLWVYKSWGRVLILSI